MVNAAPVFTPPEQKEEPAVTETEPRDVMTATELEGWLTEILHVVRDANRMHLLATAAEQHPNDVIQDVLHAIEFTPESLEPDNVFNTLVEARRVRRDVKKELEVTQVFKEWADKHKPAFDQLQNTLGTIRKILQRQPNDMYRWKTDAVGIQGSYLQKEGES